MFHISALGNNIIFSFLNLFLSCLISYVVWPAVAIPVGYYIPMYHNGNGMYLPVTPPGNIYRSWSLLSCANLIVIWWCSKLFMMWCSCYQIWIMDWSDHREEVTAFSVSKWHSFKRKI